MCNHTRDGHSYVAITRIITCTKRIGLHSVLLPLHITADELCFECQTRLIIVNKLPNIKEKYLMIKILLYILSFSLCSQSKKQKAINPRRQSLFFSCRQWYSSLEVILKQSFTSGSMDLGEYLPRFSKSERTIIKYRKIIIIYLVIYFYFFMWITFAPR